MTAANLLAVMLALSPALVSPAQTDARVTAHEQRRVVLWARVAMTPTEFADLRKATP
jgi:hypothetical protein